MRSENPRCQKPHPGRKHWASEIFPGILCGMVRWLTFVLHLAVAGLKSRRNLLLEILVYCQETQPWGIQS